MSEYLYGGEPDAFVGDTEPEAGFADLFDFDGGPGVADPTGGGFGFDLHDGGYAGHEGTEDHSEHVEHTDDQYDPAGDEDHDQYQADQHDTADHDLYQDPAALDFLDQPFDASYDLMGAAPDEHGWWADLNSDHNHEGGYETVGYDVDANPYVAH